MKSEEEKGEKLVEKLRKGVKVRRRGEQRTPVIKPSWRLNCAYSDGAHDSRSSPVLVSARKLAASLWNLHQYDRLSAYNMHRDDTRRRRHVASLDQSPELPGNASVLRSHVIASGMQNRRSNERKNYALRPVSPESYDSSSMEVMHYNPAVTPRSSVDYRGTNFGLKTSNELIKVLNRIWSLEEQHSSNISLIKALKKEVHHSRVRIKELVNDREKDRYEIEDLKTQALESRKNKDHDKIRYAIQSMKEELESERKLRKLSEALHRKLARELYEVKKLFSDATKEVERERDSRRLLEDLCDEFALGIKDYEQELHKLKQKHEKDMVAKSSREQRLILHISESWLDERMQAKIGEKTKTPSVVDKMRSEIESFLQASKGNIVQHGPSYHRSSLESIPLNMAISAPQHVGDDEDSDVNDSYCFELKKPNASDVKQHEKNHNTDEKKKSEICEILEEQGDEENGENDRKSASQTSHIMDELIKKQNHNGVFSSGSFKWGRNASPIRQWTPKLPSEEVEILESSNSKLVLDLRENSLKAKLLEARARGQRSRSRLKGSGISF